LLIFKPKEANMVNKNVCSECEEVIGFKKWGFNNLCAFCDSRGDEVNKSMGVIIADGKTDYYTQVIKSPSDTQAAMIRSAGTSHDPRTQLKAINKVSK
jgi:hypothetical protein